ncbi:hypothetical protein AA0521_1724 [Komagataeibacter intermedius NRIC 0521]|uniref:DUF4405 domain-containing protein n=1 Tax=Komagataeibacter intermedius NRIC 0521 TaxID=1307934 RepID=A0ABQ0PIG1_9PROT|nr:hypothetical protein AA0521_1724 [Komagataeibacter intermedius NRIC 0521]
MTPGGRHTSPFGGLFGWQAFETRHGAWPDGLCFLCLLIALHMGRDRIILHQRWCALIAGPN